TDAATDEPAASRQPGQPAAGRPPGLAAFHGELLRRAADQHAPEVDGVTVASLHAAKGLEWDAVCIVGLVDGTVPITYARSLEQLEEERRLLYVGITRARRLLWLSWATARSPGGRPRRPSRFLPRETQAGAGSGAGAAASATAGGQRSQRRRVALVHCRSCGATLTDGAERKLGRCLDCPSDLDEELYARLVDWRARAAAARGTPAYTVFTDATLTAIAERQPGSVTELVEIRGIGAYKLSQYGEAVLALIGGATPDELSPR
ncbi:MAG: 3'-5' exonuclease, partial [Micromonosporaceae bacterium]